MKKSFILFALLGLLATGIVAGCSAPAEEGAADAGTTATTGAAAGGEEGE